MAAEASRAEAQLQTNAPSNGIEAAPVLEAAPVRPLRGSVIHYTRTRNRFKIVPEGNMPHDAVFLSLNKMNSNCEGGRAVDDSVRPLLAPVSYHGSASVA